MTQAASRMDGFAPPPNPGSFDAWLRQGLRRSYAAPGGDALPDDLAAIMAQWPEEDRLHHS